MGLPAEVLIEPEEAIESVRPLVINVAELPEDEQMRACAERLIRRVGSTAVRGEVEDSKRFETKAGYTSLMEAIHAAANGDPIARQVVKINAGTDVIERTIKAGHVMRVRLGVNEKDEITQHGQRLEDVHLNALRFASASWQMKERSQAEALNGVRLATLRRLGLLEDYYFVVFSRYPDNMSDEEADRIGFFKDTKTCAIQAFTAESYNELIQETAFVAGVAEPGGQPHDEQTVGASAAHLGVSFFGKTAAEIIGNPLLIHKSLMPNGTIDLVALLDQETGGTFFGEAKPPQDYLKYLEICRQREAELEPTVEKIVEELIAAADELATPVAATRRLHELSQRNMLDRAFHDRTINPRVFGEVSARYIEEGRYWLDRGKADRFLDARESAQFTARSSSCPADFENESEQSAGSRAKNVNNQNSTGEKKKMTCPFCGDPNQYGDPCSSNQYCRSCTARVVNGKVTSKGNGGRKKVVQKSVSDLLMMSIFNDEKKRSKALLN